MGDAQRLLYDPRRHRDACGIGLVADARGRSSRELLDRALAGLAPGGARGPGAAVRVTRARAGVQQARTEARGRLTASPATAPASCCRSRSRSP